MKKVKVEDAVGLMLAHDITEIVPGTKKDVAFRRGTVIKNGDIEKLLDLGKGHIFVAEDGESEVHEDEAARRIALSVTDDKMDLLPPREGRVNITSRIRGLLAVDVRRLEEMNRIDHVVFTSLPDHYPVKPGDVIGATRIVPLFISEELLERAEHVGRKGLIKVLPFKPMITGLVITGTEVASGRIPDASARVEEKLEGYGLELMGKKLVPDSVATIRDAILELLDGGAELIVTTGGLSVDPDDVTKEGVEATGAKIISYGAPVFPGAMFLVARLRGRYILGAPACVYYNTITALDIVIPWVMAGERIRADRIRKLALGGLCFHCPECRYPNCYFGKGR